MHCFVTSILFTKILAHNTFRSELYHTQHHAEARSTVIAGRRVAGPRSQAHTQREESYIHIARQRGPIGVKLVGLHVLCHHASES